MSTPANFEALSVESATVVTQPSTWQRVRRNGSVRLGGIALLIGGVVVTESVYAIPGLGRLTVDAVLARDFPTIQGVILLFSVVYVMINLLVDLSYVFFDPRIRY